MPRRKMKSRGSSELTSIATANRNLKLLDKLERAKPALQLLGQVVNIPIRKQGFGRRKGDTVVEQH